MEVKCAEFGACRSTSREKVLEAANGSFDDGLRSEIITRSSLHVKKGCPLIIEEDEILNNFRAKFRQEFKISDPRCATLLSTSPTPEPVYPMASHSYTFESSVELEKKKKRGVLQANSTRNDITAC